MTTPLNLAIIVASTRTGGFGERIARWFAAEAERHGGYAAELLPLTGFEGDRTQLKTAADRFLAAIDGADAVAVVTPEYNHGYPAVLKRAIDLGYSEWQAKPVGFVSYGGMSGGLRAVEQLRQVFSEFHTVTMRDTVSFHRVEQQFDQGPHDAPGAEEAAQTLLRQLAWWGTTLRQARAASPYVGVSRPPVLRPS